MRKIIIFILLISNFAFSQSDKFRVGEELTYLIHYGFIDAGTCTLSIKDKNFSDKNTYQIIGIANTNSTFDMFFKLRDRYETYVDKETLSPWFFYRDINEDGYKYIETHIFNQDNRTVVNKSKVYEIPENTQDMFSIFYYVRSINMANIKPNDIITVPYFMTDKVYEMKIKFISKETVKTKLGNFNCLKFHPMMEKGRVFKEEEDVTIWITDNVSHVPIRIQANLVVGSVKCDLIKLK